MFAIAPTDIGWYRYLRNNPIPEEVNFWTPTPCNVRRLSKGNKFLFLLKAPIEKYVGLVVLNITRISQIKKRGRGSEQATVLKVYQN
ncbi:hypothetical protein [Aeribacillus composti]|jgi:hypothetical protein|uniref:hypothetical protein n=1 Tax=Aeribacillus composti TaxID=1868734 RepID=UPI002E1D115F|nr:hypothetical protein [Aeribacillus composti]